MGLHLTDRWIWDFWHVLDDDVHHLFYLQAPRSEDPEDRHWNVSIGHATSADLRTWTVQPDALAPAGTGAWDDCTTWTGSILRHGGQWWMFYTGTSRRESGLVQRVGAAVSEDLTEWRRHGDGPLIEADPRWYELLDPEVWPEQAWRDPWVLLAEDGTFHCFVTARSVSGQPSTRGVIGHAVSTDLTSWEIRPPVTAPGVFGHLEIPQVIELDGRWWLLFSTPATHDPSAPPEARIGGTHGFSSQVRPAGPYGWSTYHRIDGDAGDPRYGGRVILDTAGRPHLLTWTLHDAAGGFVGEIGDPAPITVRGTRLVVRR